MSSPHRIVVVGGGAGGLELVTLLGQKLGRRGNAEVALVDSEHTHIWKPLLHEVAAGTLDPGDHEIKYLAQAHWRHFLFRRGQMDGLSRTERTIHVRATVNDKGVEITPPRTIPYDTLVMAVGSLNNDFGVKGVQEHCMFLDTTEQARRFQQHLLETLLNVHAQDKPPRKGQLDVAIVGAGATGVELSAQLRHAALQLAEYGLDEIDPERNFRINIIEASDRILPQLPEQLSAAMAVELGQLGIRVHTNQRVTEVSEEAIHMADGSSIPAAIKVWAAGIKAPGFLARIDGLETNRLNQLTVTPTLQTTLDENIYALGDCAACAIDDKSFVPPRAQAAHQQATYLARALPRRLRALPTAPYKYTDYGSLVTLGRYSTVGSLMGAITGSVMISGFIARMVYLSLYKMHLVAIHGVTRTVLLTLANFLRRSVSPEVKLH